MNDFCKTLIHDIKTYWPYSVEEAGARLRAEVSTMCLNWGWWILEPVCQMLIYVLIFGVIFRASTEYYPAYVFIGLTVYYDNGNNPIFRGCFNESGIRCHSWLKNDIAFQIYSRFYHNRRLRRYFQDRIYYYPHNMDGLIILFDTKIPDHYLKMIKIKNPRAKIILWYWNEVNSENKVSHPEEFDIWSNSPADCEAYGLHYNPQFFFDSITEQHRDIREQGKMQGKQSFIFMGREKGRSDLISGIAREVEKCGWSCDINYLSTCINDRPRNPADPYSAGFEYDRCIEKILNYQGILDVVYKENSGLSLRPLESIFFHKKLITNNPIVASYDFYDENNMYIWGRSKMSLEEFLSKPYRPVPDRICRRYLVSSWLSRIKTYYGME